MVQNPSTKVSLECLPTRSTGRNQGSQSRLGTGVPRVFRNTLHALDYALGAVGFRKCVEECILPFTDSPRSVNQVAKLMQVVEIGDADDGFARCEIFI